MPTPESIAEVLDLISQISDPAEQVLVSGVLEARTSRRPVPSWDAMTPLMRVADLTLRGVITNAVP
jgi:hypothetical protein